MTRSHATRKQSYAVTVRRVNDWWAIDIPELGIHTQARRLDQVEDMARDAIALTLDVPHDQIEVGVAIRLRSDVEHDWYAVQHARGEAARAQWLATQATGEFASNLVQREGMRTREVAYLLGVSHQRVSQMLEGHQGRRGGHKQSALDALAGTPRPAGGEATPSSWPEVAQRSPRAAPRRGSPARRER